MANIREIQFKLAAKMDPRMAAAFGKSAQLMQKQQAQMIRVNEAEVRLSKAHLALARNAGQAERAEVKQARAALQLERAQMKLQQRLHGVADAGSRAARASGNFLGSMRGMLGLAASYLSIQAIASAYKSVTEALNGQLRAEQRLQTLMSNVKGTRQADINLIKRYASELQRSTVVGDEVTIQGASQLATFQLQAKYIQQLMPALQDLAVGQYGVKVSQEQMQQSANLIGKVFTGQVGALRRAGVSFDKTQAKLLKNGTQAQKVATIVQVLQENYGGLARTMAQTPEGREVQLANAWGDLQERMGAFALPLREGVVKYLAENLPRIEAFITRVGSIASKGFALIKPYVLEIAKWFQQAWQRIAPILEGMRPTLVQMGQSWATTYQNVKPVLQFILTQVLPALITVVGWVLKVASVIIEVQSRFIAFGVRIISNFDKVVAFFKQWSPLILSLLGPIGWFTNIFIRNWERIKGAAVAIVTPIRTAFRALFEWITTHPMFKFAQKVVDLAVEGGSTAIKFGANVAQRGVQMGGAALQWTNTFFGGVPQHAEGGVFNRPHIGMVAEDGAEAVVPLTKPARAQQVMAAAGLGGITFAPVINITGGGPDTRSQVEEGLRMGLREFEQMYDRMKSRRRGLSYAGA
jgi:hypothetical protein